MAVLTALAAVDGEWGIGRDGEIPWHEPDDLARFKRRTNGTPLILGRRTHESIGGPLPGRTHVVLTTSVDRYDHGRVVAASSVRAAVRAASMLVELGAFDPPVHVVGGESAYRQLLPYCHRAEITFVGGSYDCDARFPARVLERGWERREIEPPGDGLAAAVFER